VPERLVNRCGFLGGGANSRASEVLTLLKLNGEWKITHKLFHGHND